MGGMSLAWGRARAQGQAWVRSAGPSGLVLAAVDLDVLAERLTEAPRRELGRRDWIPTHGPRAPDADSDPHPDHDPYPTYDSHPEYDPHTDEEEPAHGRRDPS